MTSSDRTALGDRMKQLEAATRFVLPRRALWIVRCDGRAFHSYLHGAVKPFDEAFMADMDHVAAVLCAEISGSVFAYTQSDEISVLVCDFGSDSTEPWFGGVVQKVVSIAAATATAALISRRGWVPAPTFDARVFTIAAPVEVANYFLWRQRDATRNSISMAAQAHFSHKALQGVNGNAMQEMLFAEHGVNWNDYPAECRRGQVAIKASGEREVTYTDRRTNEECTTKAFRTWWEVMPAPRFAAEPTGFLAEQIPPMPRLVSAA